MDRMKERVDDLHPNIKNTSAQCCRDNTAQLARETEKINLRHFQEKYIE